MHGTSFILLIFDATSFKTHGEGSQDHRILIILSRKAAAKRDLPEQETGRVFDILPSDGDLQCPTTWLPFFQSDTFVLDLEQNERSFRGNRTQKQI